MTLTFEKEGQRRNLNPKNDFVAWTRRLVGSVELKNSDVVFVGYGVKAPEYDWDDYKGVDVRGKTLIMLVGDPPVPDPADPAKLDPKTFGGKAMTYYGRWTYKYEIGAQRGAAAVIIVHETEPAGYPFSVVQGNIGERVVIVGLGNSDLDDVATQVAAEQGRVIKPDPMPEKGYFHRSDHFPFALQGVPALSSRDGVDYVGKPAGYGMQITNEYISQHYHKPSDIVRPDWDMSGAVQQLQYYWMVGYRVAEADKYPKWKPGAEFKRKETPVMP